MAFPIPRPWRASAGKLKGSLINVDSSELDNSGDQLKASANMTKQGNTFNGANQLVKLDSNSKLPSVDGSNLTNVVSSGSAPYVPYSVVSAKVDTNGDPSFMISTSTQLDFDVSVPIVCCYSDGYVETNSSMLSIATGLSNGINYIIKEAGNNQAYFTLLKPVENKKAPSSPATGQLWLDLSVVPYVPKKWSGSAWVTTRFVKLGEVAITALVIGTPTNYALNGRYENTELVLANGTKYTYNANIGTQSVIVTSYIECKIAEYGYSVGDRLYYNGDGNSGSGALWYGLLPTVNAGGLTISLTTGNAGLGTVNKTTGATQAVFTTAKWSSGLIVIRSF